MERSSVLLRLGAALLALGAGAAGIVLVFALLAGVPGPVGSVPPLQTSPANAPPEPTVSGGRIPTPTDPGFPSPPGGAIVLAREAGVRALGLAIVPGATRSLVRVSVLSGAGPGATGLHVTVRFGSGTPTVLHACRAGCYQAMVATSAVGPHVTVGLGATPYAFTLPSSLRLPAGGAIVDRAAAVWRALKTLVWHESLGATPTDVLHTVYRAVAPNELAYTIIGHAASIIIGERRWDRGTPHGAWIRSVQDPEVHEPQPFWVSETDAHVLGTARVAGQRVWVVSFFDPGTPGWFEAWISMRTHRTLKLTMIAVAHFMHHVYGPFNAPFRLRPP